MKIGFSGAGGSGKTVVLNGVLKDLDLSERFILRSPVRSVLARWGVTDQNQDMLSESDRARLQMDILNTRLDEEEKYPDGFISDRTIADHYAYILVNCHKHISSDDLDNLRAKVFDNLKTYDFIFFFPSVRSWLEASGDDGVRSTSYAYQALIQSCIRDVLYPSNQDGGSVLRVVEVPLAAPEVRVDYVSSLIKPFNIPWKN